MDVTVVLNEKEKLKVEIDNLTLANLLNEKLWQQSGIDFAAYSVDHPYLAKPVLVIQGKNPKKALLDAADAVLEDISELRKKAEKELK